MSQTLIGSSTRTVKVNLTQNSPFSPFYSVRTQLKIDGDNRNRWEHLWWWWNRRLFVWWCLKIVSIEFQWNHALFTKKKKSSQASDMHVLHVCLKILVIKYLQVLRNFLFFPLIFSVYVTVNVMVGGITCINYYDSSSSCQLRIVEKNGLFMFRCTTVLQRQDRRYLTTFCTK